MVGRRDAPQHALDLDAGVFTLDDPARIVRSLKRSAEHVRCCALARRARVSDYQHRGGSKTNVLADFFIGVQASVLGAQILTRDAGRYRNYTSEVERVGPQRFAPAKITSYFSKK